MLLDRERQSRVDRVITLALGLWLVLCAPLTAAAEEKGEEKEEKPRSDEAEFSYVTSSGNAKVQTLSTKNRYQLEFADHYTFLWKLQALKGKTNGALTAERYFTDLRLEYAFDHAYVYGNAGWLQDTFAGLDRRVNRGFGGGYKFLDGPVAFFKLEAVLNEVDESYTDSASNPDRSSTEGRLYGEYTHAFTKKNRFSQSLELLRDLHDSTRYRANSETALIAALNDRFSIKLSYELRYNNKPVPETLLKTDRVLSTALVANF